MEIVRFTLGSIRSNCYVIKENNQALIVDPGFESTELLEYLKKENLDVKFIYVTHGHFDHCGGVNFLKEKYPKAISLAPIKDKIWFTKSEYNRLGYEVVIDVWVNEGDIINLLGNSFKVYETPGHSKGGTVLYMDKILFSGDTLFFQSIGRTDVPFGDMGELRESIKKIYKTFSDETIVYPGHGRATTIKHEKEFNPFVRE